MGSKNLCNINSVLCVTSCAPLLHDLQVIWDEVGESESDREKILWQLEEECLDVYRRKVDQANLSRARMHQLLADSAAELAHLVSALGETSTISRLEKHNGSLKEQLAAIEPTLIELRRKKQDRIKMFKKVQEQIESIFAEITGKPRDSYRTPCINEQDLSMRKLDEYHAELQELHREKNERLQKVSRYVDAVLALSTVMGLEFSKIISEVHPSLDDRVGSHSKSISDITLEKLALQVESLKEEKQSRLQKIQKLAITLTELWDLMDTPLDDKRCFDHITCYISASVDDVVMCGALSLDVIEQAQVEVKRLDQLKASKLKELLLRKQAELEGIYKNAHMEMDTCSTQEKLMAMIDSGTIDHTQLLASMDDQIEKAKEEAFSRKEIMEKVEKWMTACEEENWLEEYNMDENRYTVSRGAHINLKRAERARIIVNKIPALVESLMAKTRAWEEERGTVFCYDDVPLLAMLDEYSMLRQEREEQKRRLRDKKRFQGQLAAEQEAFFGSRLGSLNKFQMRAAASRPNGNSLNDSSMNRRLSLGVQRLAINGNQAPRHGYSTVKNWKRDFSRPGTPMNFGSIQKEVSSQFSTGSVPSSP